MARAIALNPREDSWTGDSVTFVCQVRFIGTELTAPDSDWVYFTVAANDSASTIATNFAASIRTAATLKGISLPNNSILLPAYVKA